MLKPRLSALLAFVAVVSIGAIAFAASETVRFVVLSTTGFVLYGFPSEADRSDAQMIREKIMSVHTFKQDSRSRPGQPPVFATVGSKQLLRTPTIITVYDVPDHDEQDKIASGVAQLAAEKHFPPLTVCFYERENWIVDGNLGLRGSENQLRCLRIAGDRAREVSGPKVITYPTP